MADVAETIEYKGHVIEVHYSDSHENPYTDWEHYFHWYCWHRRYNIGEQFNYSDRNELFQSLILDLDSDVMDEMSDEALYEHIQAARRHFIAPVYMYEHGNVAFSLGSFACRWDSGLLGYVVVTDKEIEAEFNTKNLDEVQPGQDKTVAERIESYISGFLDCYTSWSNGEVYGFIVKKAPTDPDEDIEDCEELDSCWGFIGSDHEKSGLLEHAQSFIDYEVGKSEKSE